MSNLRAKAVFCVLAFMSAGCLTPERKGPHVPDHPPELVNAILSQKEVTGDVVIFKDIRQLDIDKDGEKEIITVFAGKARTSGVKVIKPSLGEENSVIYEQLFATPNTQIVIKEGACTIIAEDFDLDKESVVKKSYHWNGKTFVPGK